MLALTHIASGKVREIYEIDHERLLFVATDRISAYDVVFGDEIPDKGAVLTGLSLFWFDLLDVPNHLLSTDLSTVPGIDANERASLAPRSMIVRRAEVVPMECVVRGYLYGSSWREYRDGGGPATEHLPTGLGAQPQAPTGEQRHAWPRAAPARRSGQAPVGVGEEGGEARVAHLDDGEPGQVDGPTRRGEGARGAGRPQAPHEQVRDVLGRAHRCAACSAGDHR